MLIPIVNKTWLHLANRVSSESNFDFLRVRVQDPTGNETQIYSRSGVQSWADMPPYIFRLVGKYRVRISYTKDSSVSAGSDTAWVDDIVIGNSSTREAITETYLLEDFEGAAPTWSQVGNFGWAISSDSANNGLFSFKSQLPFASNGQSAGFQFFVNISFNIPPLNFTTESINSKQLFRWDNMVWYCGVNLAFGTPQYEKSLIDYNSIEADRVVLTLTSDARFNLSSSSRTPFKIFCKVFDAPATLRLRDASGFYWDRELPVSDWTLISPNWSEFVWSPINPVIQQGRSPDQSANIQELYILTNNKIQIWWIGSNPPETLSLPTTIYRAGVRDRGSGDRSLYVGDIYPTNTPSDTLNYTPGVVPFARNIINGSVGNLTGLPYSAYQNVWGLVKWAEESRLNNVIQFIKDAQVAYTSSVGDVGPFAPVYTWNDPNNASTGDTINTFGFNGFDNFEQSGEYQAQLGLWLARAWYENRSNSDLRTLAMSWLNWLDQVYGTRQDTLPPNSFPSNSIATAGNNPGVQALIGEAALWCNLSGGDPATTFRWIYRSLTYLNSQFVGAGNPMSGSWSNSQLAFDATLKQYYSLWHGAAINFLSLLEQHKPEITYPSCSEPLAITVSVPFTEVCCGGTINNKFWKCSNGECVYTLIDGIYATKEECEAAKVPIISSFTSTFSQTFNGDNLITYQFTIPVPSQVAGWGDLKAYLVSGIWDDYGTVGTFSAPPTIVYQYNGPEVLISTGNVPINGTVTNLLRVLCFVNLQIVWRGTTSYTCP